MTEAAHQMASNPLPPAVRKPGTVGTAAGPEVAVLDASGKELPAGEIGEVAIRGESVFAGYETSSDAEPFTDDGWFRTGDEGFLDEEGYLTLRGRIKEIINRGGEKVSPLEVDDALLAHQGVAQAVTFAMSDSQLGEEVAAAVVLAPDAQRRRAEPPGLRRRPAGAVQGAAPDPRRRRAAEGPDRQAPADRARRAARHRERREPRRRPPPVPLPRAAADRDLGVGARHARARRRLGLLRARRRLDPRRGGGGARARPRRRSRSAADLDRARADAGRDGERGRLLCRARQLRRRPAPEGRDADAALPRPPRRRRAPDVSGPDERGSAPDQPSYGLRARGIDDDGEAMPSSLPEIAADYVSEVRKIQPHGPYVLGGFCVGGAIAVEMASQLQAAGEEIGLLVLLDPRFGRPRGLRADLWRITRAVRERRLMRAVGRKVKRYGRGRPGRRWTSAASSSDSRESFVPRPVDAPADRLPLRGVRAVRHPATGTCSSLVSAKRWEQLPCDHARLLASAERRRRRGGDLAGDRRARTRAEHRVTPEPGWTNPPARPTIEPGELAVWLLDADVEQPAGNGRRALSRRGGRRCSHRAHRRRKAGRRGRDTRGQPRAQRLGRPRRRRSPRRWASTSSSCATDVAGWALPAHALAPRSSLALRQRRILLVPFSTSGRGKKRC